MERQLSFGNDKPSLYLVATPIGNMSDITFRAIEILKSVDYIFAEDTRVSINLLRHYDINVPIMSYHEHNKESQGNIIIDKLASGMNIALISDAGMPVISDPGYEIACMAMDKGYNVVSIPGANAALSALIVSGLAPMPFAFYGFLDSKHSHRIKKLEELKEKRETLIFYEAPHRIKDTLTDILEIMGNRKMALVRELTKKFEEVVRGNVAEIIDIVDTIKGEMVIILDGNKKEQDYSHLSIIEHVNLYIKEGYRQNDAMKKVASDRHLSKSEIYKEYHSIK